MRRHAVVVHQLPELWQMLNQRRDDLLGRADVGQRIGDDEGLQPGQRLERHLRHVLLVELLDVHAAAMRQRHRRSPELGRIGDGEIDLVLGGDAALERDAIGLGDRIAVPMLDEIQPFLLFQRGLEVGRLADQAGLALLADAAAKQRLDEDQLVPVDQALNLILGCARPQNLGSGELDMFEQPRSVQHSGDLHRSLRDVRAKVIVAGCLNRTDVQQRR